MDAFWWIVGTIVVWMFIAGIAKAKQETAEGRSQEMSEEIFAEREVYFAPPQVKFIDEVHEETGWIVKKIMFRGIMPNDRDMNISFALSAFDATEGENDPIFSLIESAQEPDTICYQTSGDFGYVSEGSASADWINLGIIIPELIQPAYSGKREIHVILRMFNSLYPPTIHGGLSYDDGEIILSKILKFNFEFKDKGYEEASKDREEAQIISVKIGVAVAMSDRSLDKREGEKLKEWIIKEISGYSDSRREYLKNLLNSALKEGYAEAKKGELSLSYLADRLNEIGEKKSKYDAIELCFDIMAADDKADPEEMAVIRNMAKSLNLDMDEIERMREKVTLNLSAELTSEEGMESLVGIEASWSDDKKRKHLRTEFQKWNNRLNSLPDGEERESAQSMLNNIAILRKKYG